MDKLGVIQKLNGMESRKIWGDEKCDKITGTDGTMFPPKLFQNPNATLHVYSKEMCRTVPLYFYGHARAQDIPTLRYVGTLSYLLINIIRILPPIYLYSICKDLKNRLNNQRFLWEQLPS